MYTRHGLGKGLLPGWLLPQLSPGRCLGGHICQPELWTWGRKDGLLNWASFPQLPYVSTAIGIHIHPNSRHFGSLAACFLLSADRAATPAI